MTPEQMHKKIVGTICTHRKYFWACRRCFEKMIAAAIAAAVAEQKEKDAKLVEGLPVYRMCAMDVANAIRGGEG